MSIASLPKKVLCGLLYQSSTHIDLYPYLQTIWSWYFVIFGPKSILPVEGIKTHSKSQFITNGAVANLLKFWKLTHWFFSRSKTDFVWLIARQCFTWHSKILELEKHCKKYREKCFLPWCFV